MPRVLVEVASSSYILVMRSVGLKVLKNKLSEYVRLAAGGETVLITDRDRVVAEISPPRAGRSPLLADAMLEDAYHRGLITPAVNPTEAVPPSDPVMTFQDLMRELEERRQDR
jgi:antitoxin (DNA-binding transcriptional repressor) of toxin-antitoxin stability system